LSLKFNPNNYFIRISSISISSSIVSIRDVNRHGEFRHKPWHGMAWRYRHAPPQGGKLPLRHAPPCHRIFINPPCGGFPPQHFNTAMADFRQRIFRPPQHFLQSFQN
jgi:hypothetical protein